MKIKDFFNWIRSKDIKIYRSNNYEYIKIIKDTHNEYIKWLFELKYGSIISFSKDITIKI